MGKTENTITSINGDVPLANDSHAYKTTRYADVSPTPE